MILAGQCIVVLKRAVEKFDFFCPKKAWSSSNLKKERPPTTNHPKMGVQIWQGNKQAGDQTYNTWLSSSEGWKMWAMANGTAFGYVSTPSLGSTTQMFQTVPATVGHTHQLVYEDLLENESCVSTPQPQGFIGVYVLP